MKDLAPEKQAAVDLRTKDFAADELVVGVVFQKSWKRYYPGDKAGFPKLVADKLVAGKVATYREAVKDAEPVKAGDLNKDGGGEWSTSDASALKSPKSPKKKKG